MIGVPEKTVPTEKFSMGPVEVRVFGRKTGDWGVRDIITAKDPSDLPDGWEEIIRNTARVGMMLGAKRVLVPIPYRTNAEVCGRGQLKVAIQPVGQRIPLRTGWCADGVILKGKHAFFVASADCPTIVVWDPNRGPRDKTSRVVAAHAGRDCLMDRGVLDGTMRARQYESVVHAAIANVRGNAQELRALILCGIGPENFRHYWKHPVYGERNRRMIRHIIHRWGKECAPGTDQEGRINLPLLIRRQMVQAGLRDEHIVFDGIDTYGDTEEDGSPRWWSHARGDKKRNGIFVAVR